MRSQETLGLAITRMIAQQFFAVDGPCPSVMMLNRRQELRDTSKRYAINQRLSFTRTSTEKSTRSNVIQLLLNGVILRKSSKVGSGLD